MSSNKSLADRTEAVYRELRAMRRRFRLSSWITLIVGGLLLLLVVFYFTYGYLEIARLKDPELIVSLVGQTVDDQIPTLRQNLESQVNENASKWAKQASDQVIDAIPQLREEIEKYAIQQSDVVIAKIDNVGEEKFREILNQNRAALQNTINELKRGEEAPDDVMLTLQHAIEQELQIDSENQAEALRAFVTDLNANMEKLKAGEGLNREQKAERRALILARTLQKKHLGDIKAEDLAGVMPSTITQAVEEKEAKRLRQEAKEASAATAQDLGTTEAKDEPAKKPEAAKDTPAEAKPEEAKPTEKPEAEKPADKPAEKPEEKAAAKPEEKPADMPADKPEEKAEAEKPEAKKDAPAEEKPADQPKDEAKPAEKADDAPAKEDKPAEKPEEKKEEAKEAG